MHPRCSSPFLKPKAFIDGVWIYVGLCSSSQTEIEATLKDGMEDRGYRVILRIIPDASVSTHIHTTAGDIRGAFDSQRNVFTLQFIYASSEHALPGVVGSI